MWLSVQPIFVYRDIISFTTPAHVEPSLEYNNLFIRRLFLHPRCNFVKTASIGRAQEAPLMQLCTCERNIPSPQVFVGGYSLLHKVGVVVMEYKQYSSSHRRDYPKQILEVCSEDLLDGPADQVQETIRSLCQICIDYGLLQRMSQFSLNSRSSRATEGIFPYGSREDLRSRQACSFCRLVNRLLPLDLSSSTPIQVRPRLEHRPDRHLDIYAGIQIQMSVEVVHHGFDKPDVKLCPKMEPAEICGYLQRCENSHDHSRLKDNRLYHTPIDLTFISVPEGRLVRGSSRDRYFALSYVWGGISMFQTTMSNRSSFEKPGSLTSIMEEIPATIQDSIALMQRMGERYLWVDSLV